MTKRYGIYNAAVRNSAGNFDFERPCVLLLNPTAGAYDSVGEIVLIGRANPYAEDSESWERHNSETLAILRTACDALNAA